VGGEQPCDDRGTRRNNKIDSINMGPYTKGAEESCLIHNDGPGSVASSGLNRILPSGVGCTHLRGRVLGSSAKH